MVKPPITEGVVWPSFSLLWKQFGARCLFGGMPTGTRHLLVYGTYFAGFEQNESARSESLHRPTLQRRRAGRTA
jgi:hypothetical protein